MAVYLIECNICCEQCTGSTETKFRSRANNYKSTQRKFHEHYCSDRHNGIEDWVITLIDSVGTLKELRTKELYGMYRLKSYAPYGLNKRDAYEVF